MIKNLFGIDPKADYTAMLKQGASIIDVRSEAEYRIGHIKGSVNIPLSKLSRYCSKLNKEKPIITCCASGMRSAQAKNVLKSKGFSEVHNGGSWNSLQNKIK
jgi:phage shock protein E